MKRCPGTARPGWKQVQLHVKPGISGAIYHRVRFIAERPKWASISAVPANTHLQPRNSIVDVAKHDLGVTICVVT